MISNVVQVVLNETDQYFETQPVFAKNHGNYLEFTGVDLPDYFEVHFAKEETGTSIRDIAENHLVRIPDELLLTGDQIYAWIYLHTTGEDGETMCAIRIPVNRRADITNVEPEPVQHDIIEQAIAALQNGIEDVQEIEAGIPEMVDNLLDEAKSSGEFDGPPGFSPTVDVTNIPGGHRVVISDAEGDHIFSVMDGRDGGAAELIDDQAGAGDLSKTWSANKTTEELSTKADTTDTVLETTLSRGRSPYFAVGTGSFAFGSSVTAGGSYSHAEGSITNAFGNYSHAEGAGTTADGHAAHAEGHYAEARAKGAHAEGIGGPYTKDGQTINTGARAEGAHAEGYRTLASAEYAHAEGYMTQATKKGAHAEGDNTVASDNYAHAEGSNTNAASTAAHAEGSNTTSSGSGSHAEGGYATASGNYSHAEGNSTTASTIAAHAEGGNTTASGMNSHAEGYSTTASGYASHAEGEGGTYTQSSVSYSSGAKGTNDHAEGYQTIAQSTGSGESSAAHAEGVRTKALNLAAHAEGKYTVASGIAAHVEGENATASGRDSHAEGTSTVAQGYASHAEGTSNHAIGNDSHAEGANTRAYGFGAHAEGSFSNAYGGHSHVEGSSAIAYGENSRATGKGVIAVSDNSSVFGKHNIPDRDIKLWSSGMHVYVDDIVFYLNGNPYHFYQCTEENMDETFDSSKYTVVNISDYAEVVGGGTSAIAADRKNIRALDWNGNERLFGDVYVGCNADSTGGTKLAKLTDIPAVATTTETQAIITEYGVSA